MRRRIIKVLPVLPLWVQSDFPQDKDCPPFCWAEGHYQQQWTFSTLLLNSPKLANFYSPRLLCVCTVALLVCLPAQSDWLPWTWGARQRLADNVQSECFVVRQWIVCHSVDRFLWARLSGWYKCSSCLPEGMTAIIKRHQIVVNYHEIIHKNQLFIKSILVSESCTNI